MKKFSLRIQDLLEKTTNESVKNECNKVLDIIAFSPDENVVIETMISNLEKISNLNEDEMFFIDTEKRLLVLENMNLKKIFEVLFNNSELFKANPQIGYSLNPLKTAFEQKKYPAIYTANRLRGTLNEYSFIPIVENELNKINEIFNKYQEDIILKDVLYRLETSRNNKFYQEISEKIGNYLIDKKPANREKLIEDLSYYKYEPLINYLIENLNQFKSDKYLNIKTTNKNDVLVERIYSFIHINNEEKPNKYYFKNNGQYFKVVNEKIEVCTDEEVITLPETFKQINDYIHLNPNIYISENKATIYLSETKMVFEINSNHKKQMYIDDKLVEDNNWVSLIQSTVNRNRNSEINTIKKIWENFETLVEIDFAKNIKSKLHPGVVSSIYKMDENFYIHLINPMMNKNEFLTEANALQTKNTILEFLNIDITESLYEFFEGTVFEIGKLKSKQQEINESILYLNSQLNKIDKEKNNILLENNEDIKKLRESINDEIGNLKAKYNSIQTEIDSLSTIQEKDDIDDGVKDVEVNDTVRIKDSGIIGKIIDTNTTTKSVIVLTDEGDTVETNADNIVQIDDEITQNIDDLQNKAEEVEDVPITKESKEEEEESKEEEEEESKEEEEEVKESDDANTNVKIKDTGEIGKIINKSDVTNSITVLLDDGEERELSIDDVEELDKDPEMPETPEEMEDKAEKTDKEEVKESDDANTNVKIKDTGEIGKIINKSDVTNSITVLLDDGEERELSIDDVEELDKDPEMPETPEEMEDKAEKTDKEEKEK